MGAAAEDVVDAAANVNGGMTTTTTTTASTASTAASTTAASSSGASSRYLVVFHAVSAGLNGAALGADEQEIVFIVAVVLDVRDNQVRGGENLIHFFIVLKVTTHFLGRKLDAKSLQGVLSGYGLSSVNFQLKVPPQDTLYSVSQSSLEK